MSQLTRILHERYRLINEFHNQPRFDPALVAAKESEAGRPSPKIALTNV
jgi:hypothetical protein